MPCFQAMRAPLFRKAPYSQQRHHQWIVEHLVCWSKPPETSNHQENKVFCSNCQTENPAAAKFCRQCGSQIDDKGTGAGEFVRPRSGSESLRGHAFPIMVGLISAIVCAITFRIPIISFSLFNGFSSHGYEQLLVGIVFGIGLIICMKKIGFSSGTTDCWLIVSSVLVWIVYSSLTEFLAPVVYFKGLVGSFAVCSLLGALCATIISMSTQLSCDRIIEARAVKETTLVGGFAGLALMLDFGMGLPAGAPWFNFMLWQPAILTSLSSVMRIRSLKSHLT
jgi:ribosomal protein L40E